MSGELLSILAALDTIEVAPHELPHLRDDFRHILLDRHMLGIETSQPWLTYIQPLHGARCFLRPMPTTDHNDIMIIKVMERLFKLLTEEHLPEEWSPESTGLGKVSWDLQTDFITIKTADDFEIILPPAFSCLPVLSTVLCGGPAPSDKPKEIPT